VVKYYLPIFIPEVFVLMSLLPLLLYRRIKYDCAFMRIKLTRGKYAIVDAKNFLKLYTFKWYAKESFETFYAVRSFFENGKKRHIFMHRQIMNPPKDKCIDHRNQNGLDNRRTNLREASKAQNNYNREKIAGLGTSIYKGVMWHKHRKKWYAAISVNGQKIFLGYFDSEIEAAKAYDQAAILYHGEFASLNFPSTLKPPTWSLPRETCPMRCDNYLFGIRSYLIGASLNFDSAPASQLPKSLFGL
jgi:hypothetical protein